jgi:hypothetical protein
MVNFLDVMDLWGSPQALADDLGVKLSRVQKWRARKAIPPNAWPQVLAAAKRRRFAVNADTLVRISAKQMRAQADSRLSA